MSLWKRGRRYWMDVTVNGQRVREPLGTTDWREARQVERRRVTELAKRSPDPVNRRGTIGNLNVSSAIAAYAEERRAQVSARMVAYWMENARPLSAFFKQTRLRDIDAGMIASYQNFRSDQGRAAKTVNGELSVLRQVLRHARLWYRVEEDYKPLRNMKPPVGQALTEDEQARLFQLATSKPQWFFAYVAATLSFFVGLRQCEILGLQWKHIDLIQGRIEVRRSKTPAGWREPSMNRITANVLGELRTKAQAIGFAEPEHYLFPWHGRDKKLDPARPMTSWRSAWRSLRMAAGLATVRFHDGRHTALTRLAEAGQPDWVIQAQLGHVSPAMMKTYSHVRRLALDEAAAALEPRYEIARTTSTPEATSQDASQEAAIDAIIEEIVREVGSSGRTRTYNPPVNSRMLCH